MKKNERSQVADAKISRTMNRCDFVQVLVLLFLASVIGSGFGFSTPPVGTNIYSRECAAAAKKFSLDLKRGGVSRMNMSSDEGGDGDEFEKLKRLGYSEDEIRRSRKDSSPEPVNVRMDIVDDVDAFTLTAGGFLLIALNFFVFANLGDGGIAGLIATIINKSR